MSLTTEEAAQLAGVAAATIRTWVMRGLLTPLTRGVKPLRFHYEDVARVQADLRPSTWTAAHKRAQISFGLAIESETIEVGTNAPKTRQDTEAA